MSAPTLTIDIVSDVVCPWCYIGKRRLEAALALPEAAQLPKVEIRWHPFQLNPELPAQGLSILLQAPTVQRRDIHPAGSQAMPFGPSVTEVTAPRGSGGERHVVRQSKGLLREGDDRGGHPSGKESRGSRAFVDIQQGRPAGGLGGMHRPEGGEAVGDDQIGPGPFGLSSQAGQCLGGRGGRRCLHDRSAINHLHRCAE